MMAKRIFGRFSGVVIFLVFVLVMCIAGGCSSSSSSGSSGKSSLKTYIASDLTSDIGAELAGRFTNVVTSYDASGDIINFVVEAKDLASSETLQSQALGHLLQDRNLIVLNPTYNSMEALYEYIYYFVRGYETEQFKDLYEDDAAGEIDYEKDYFNRYWSDDVDTFLNQFRLVEDDDGLKALLQCYKEFDDGDVPVLDVVGFRGDCYYAAETENGVSSDCEVISTDISESSLDAEEQKEEQTSTVSDGQYKANTHEELTADGCIEWINEYKASSNSTDAATLASASNSLFTADNAYQIKHDFTVSAETNDKARTAVLYYVWPCYSFATSRDYIIVQGHISCHNQDYECSLSQERDCWYDRGGQNDIYGPYFYKIKIENCVYDETEWVPDPSNPDGGPGIAGTIMPGANPPTTQGATNYSEGFTFSFSGAMSVAASGPSVGVTLGCSWNEGSSRNVPDISTTREDLKAGAGNVSMGSTWTFQGNQPRWQWKAFKTNEHDAAVPIIRSQFDSTLNFGIEVWERPEVEGSKGDPWGIKSYALDTEITVENSTLHKKDGHTGDGTCKFKKRDPFPVPCRYKTTCAMYMTSTAHPEKVTALEEFLKKKATAYSDAAFDVATVFEPNTKKFPIVIYYDDTGGDDDDDDDDDDTVIEKMKKKIKVDFSDGWKGYCYLNRYVSNKANTVAGQVADLKDAIKAAGFGDMQEIQITIKAINPPNIGDNKKILTVKKIDLTK